MKRLLITLAAAAMALSAASAEEIEKVYDFGDISSIRAGNNFNIHVTYGRSDKVRVVCDSEYEQFLDVRYVAQDRLELFLEQDSRIFKLKKLPKNGTPAVEVFLEMDDISLINLSGAAKASFTGNFKSSNLNIDLSGAAGLNGLMVNGNSLDADCSGAASADITGNFKKYVEVEVSGAAKLSLEGDSDALEADISGASKLECTGNFNTCEINCSGASKAEITGKGTRAEYECSGASSIDAKDFHAKSVDMELTGASGAKVYASEELHYNVSRSSKMTYYGDAKLYDRNINSNVVKGR